MANKKNVTWEEIGKLREEALTVREKDGRAPKELVNRIEDIQRQFDEDTGFSLCQMESHTIALRISQDRKKGTIGFDDLIDMVDNLQKLMEAIKPGFGKRIRLRLAGLATGSVTMMADTDTMEEDPSKPITPDEEQLIADTDAVLRTVVKAASILTEKGSPAEKTNRFRAETNLDIESSYRVMLAMDNLKPDNKDLNLSVNTPELAVGNESPTVSVAITKENKSDLQKTKSDAYHALEPEKIKTIEGRIVQLEHFDDLDLKFGVLTEKEGHPRVYPVHYERKYDNRVKQSKGENVRVKIEKGERRQWFLAEWL